ncbi:glutamine synthetase [Bordetella pertussis]|nr:glutamine synthetase [Bordetella pertussis]
MASPKDVLKQIADNEVKFVDFRFTDTLGREHHVSVPTSAVDEDKLESGQAFDGSSIPGWKGIEASDMLLIPDLDTANLDPFREEPTLILSCDVVEPSDLKGYDRDPRSLAKRAEAYLKSSGLGDTAYFGPEPEFFVFDGVTWNTDMSGTFVKIKSEEAPWSSGLEFEGGNMGHRPGPKAATSPCRRSIRSRTCVPKCACCSSRWACRSKCTTMKWPRPASWKSAPSSARWCNARTGTRS